MLPSHRIATHPGVILQEEFLEPMGQTPLALAKHIGLSEQTIEAIVCGKRGILPETAWLLAQSSGTTPEFWLTLQANYDLSAKRPHRQIERLGQNTPLNSTQ